jgi:hypothetical protein
MIALMMEAASTSETQVNFYHTTWRNIPKTGIFILLHIWAVSARRPVILGTCGFSQSLQADEGVKRPDSEADQSQSPPSSAVVF